METQIFLIGKYIFATLKDPKNCEMCFYLLKECV